MQFDGDHLRAVVQQLRCDRAATSADVDDQVARLDTCICDEPSRPLLSEPMPAPRPARPSADGGHDGPRS
jgi:hypothetical protein